MYIVFDGHCGLCSRVAVFVARRDARRRFLLVSSLSPMGRLLLSTHGLTAMADRSVALICGNQSWIRGKAIGKILAQLPGWMWLAQIIDRTPPLLVDGVYHAVARLRKRLGLRHACSLADAALMKERFIL